MLIQNRMGFACRSGNFWSPLQRSIRRTRRAPKVRSILREPFSPMRVTFGGTRFSSQISPRRERKREFDCAATRRRFEAQVANKLGRNHRGGMKSKFRREERFVTPVSPLSAIVRRRNMRRHGNGVAEFVRRRRSKRCGRRRGPCERAIRGGQAADTSMVHGVRMGVAGVKSVRRVSAIRLRSRPMPPN